MKYFPIFFLCISFFLSPFFSFGIDHLISFQTDPPQMLKIKRGTKITLQLNTEVNSRTAAIDNVIEMMVLLDVKVKGKTVVSSGTYAEGIVTRAKRAGIFGKGAKLELEGINVLTIDGQRIPIKSVKVSRKGRNRKGLALGTSLVIPTVGIIMGTPLLIPFAVVGIFVKGRNVEIPVGTLVTAKIMEDITVQLESK
ncbi:MAG: hypothetical protein AAF573_21440 [Bacteroidota bacterium]